MLLLTVRDCSAVPGTSFCFHLIRKHAIHSALISFTVWHKALITTACFNHNKILLQMLNLRRCQARVSADVAKAQSHPSDTIPKNTLVTSRNTGSLFTQNSGTEGPYPVSILACDFTVPEEPCCKSLKYCGQLLLTVFKILQFSCNTYKKRARMVIKEMENYETSKAFD